MIRTFVVMEARFGSRTLWAWGEVGDGPGFEDVTYTEPDGFTLADVDSPPALGAHLFTVAVPVECRPSAVRSIRPAFVNSQET